MGFRADRAQRHGTSGKAADDFRDRFDLIQRNRLATAFVGLANFEQAAQGQQVFVLRVNQAGIFTILVAAVAAHGMLQRADGFGVPDMVFAAHAHGVFAAHIERVGKTSWCAKGCHVPLDGFLAHFVQADAFNSGRCAGEIAVDKILGQPDRVKNLRAAIRLIGRNAHFGHDFANAFAGGFDVVRVGFRARQVKPQAVA